MIKSRSKKIRENDSIIPRWLKLKEATEYGNIGKKRLIDMAISGIIRGAKDADSKRGDWIFDRLSIDAYWDSQMPDVNIREKAIMILNSVHGKLNR